MWNANSIYPPSLLLRRLSWCQDLHFEVRGLGMSKDSLGLCSILAYSGSKEQDGKNSAFQISYAQLLHEHFERSLPFPISVSISDSKDQTNAWLFRRYVCLSWMSLLILECCQSRYPAVSLSQMHSVCAKCVGKHTSTHSRKYICGEFPSSIAACKYGR